MATEAPPIALTIAGSDSSGGAGIQADLKTFSALGVYGASVVTALTAQNTTGVSGVLAIPADFIAAQFHSVVSDLTISAIKTGMLGDAATVEIVTELLSDTPGVPVIVDPVMVATSGDVLLAPDAIDAVRLQLIPRAALITPNVPEAATLLDVPPAQSESEMQTQAEALLKLGCGAVLLKGGHAEGADAVDVFFDRSGVHLLRQPRIATDNTHGTGCTLSAAIAAYLAQGHSMEDAIVAAKAFVWNALASGAHYAIGRGHGPVDHLFALRKTRPGS